VEILILNHRIETKVTMTNYSNPTKTATHSNNFGAFKLERETRQKRNITFHGHDMTRTSY